MRLVDLWQVKRVHHVFELPNGERIPADRLSSDGYGVLAVFEPSKLDIDFNIAGYDYWYWFPSAKSLDWIQQQLDLSDRLTCDWLHNGEGWNTGPRPYKAEKIKLETFM